MIGSKNEAVPINNKQKNLDRDNSISHKDDGDDENENEELITCLRYLKINNL